MTASSTADLDDSGEEFTAKPVQGPWLWTCPRCGLTQEQEHQTAFDAVETCTQCERRVRVTMF